MEKGKLAYMAEINLFLSKIQEWDIEWFEYSSNDPEIIDCIVCCIPIQKNPDAETFDIYVEPQNGRYRIGVSTFVRDENKVKNLYLLDRVLQTWPYISIFLDNDGSLNMNPNGDWEGVPKANTLEDLWTFIEPEE